MHGTDNACYVSYLLFQFDGVGMASSLRPMIASLAPAAVPYLWIAYVVKVYPVDVVFVCNLFADVCNVSGGPWICRVDEPLVAFLDDKAGVFPA